MRTKRSSMFKFVTSLAVCGFLLGVSTAGAITSSQRQREEPGSQSKAPSEIPRKHIQPAAGPVKGGLQSFLRSLAADGSGYCQSSCCWASGCDSVSCSSSSCSATCGDSFAFYSCN